MASPETKMFSTSGGLKKKETPNPMKSHVLSSYLCKKIASVEVLPT
jgi:hypothetical protein